MEKAISQQVEQVIEHYPADAKRTFTKVRELVVDAASATAGLENTQETLKWGEPSYLADGGSTVRMKWTEKQPEQFSLFFNCNSMLVETFRELYQDEFVYDGNRALSFKLSDPIPADALKHCISMSMQYHAIKKLPLLGN